MLPEELVRMANQVALFFEAYPDDEALEGVRDHLRKFWDPAMRRELIEIEVSGTLPLRPLVARAVQRLAQA